MAKAKACGYLPMGNRLRTPRHSRKLSATFHSNRLGRSIAMSNTFSRPCGPAIRFLVFSLLFLLFEYASFGYAPAAEPSQPARPQTVKVAGVQCSSELGNVAANTKKLT